MGNFGAHIDEGITFFLLALWWMYNIYKNYIQSVEEKRPYRSYCSYYVMLKGRRLPAETIMKIIFPIGGLLTEVLSTDSFLEKNGNFRNIGKFHHISIFALFILHGVSDFLETHRFSAIKGMKYFTFSVAFIWYGVAFYFHCMPDLGKPALENTMHRLLVPFLIITGMAVMFEFGFRNSIIPQIVRCYLVLCAGEWIILTSFVLFLPTPFPGRRRNPAWDQDEISNVRFMEAAVGFMLVANIAFMIISYTLMALYMKYARVCFKNRETLKYRYTPLENLEKGEF
ncbi:transmembrane protein 45A-like [Mercenaria mercenaria]|uniref:transmembrane protein 45A-like n=1 Tax=Mercenaria mercenaria TaxID=6596 RepID=UPI00234FA20C|nr:transmembrane protein 45A-like [Mercenaria mercenaria]